MMQHIQFFCDECGELDAVERVPTVCPRCGGNVNYVSAHPDKTTRAERAAFWFKKMREIVEQAGTE